MSRTYKKCFIPAVALLVLITALVSLLKMGSERNNLRIYLKDGRFLNVVDCEAVSDELLKVTFVNGVQSFVPRATLDAERTAKYFDGEEHSKGEVDGSGFPSVTYPVANWLTQQPVELVSLISTDSYGVYKSDMPYQDTLVVKGVLEGKADQDISLNELRYIPQKRSLVNFTAALRKDLPKIIEKPNLNPGLGGLLRITLSLDREYSVALAEAAVRFAPKDEYVNAIELLCEVYFRTGKKTKLRAFVESPKEWKLEGEKTKLFEDLKFSSEDDFKQAWLGLQLAVLSGSDDAEIANQINMVEESIQSKSKIDQKKIKLLEGIRSRQNFSKNPYANLGETDKSRLADISRKYAVQLEILDVPFVERYAEKSEQYILDEIDLYSKVYGNMSKQMVDSVLYLMEQRKYDGVEIPVSDLLWGAIYIQSLYGRERALPVFSLAQKTAVLNPGNTHTKQTLAQQFGVEAGLYFANSLNPKDSKDAKLLSILDTHLIEITGKSVEIGKAATAGTAASHYRVSTTLKRWGKMGALPQFHEKLREEFTEYLEDPDPNVRQAAFEGDLICKFSSGEYESAKKKTLEVLSGGESSQIKVSVLRYAIAYSVQHKDAEFFKSCQKFQNSLQEQVSPKSPEAQSLALFKKRIKLIENAGGSWLN